MVAKTLISSDETDNAKRGMFMLIPSSGVSAFLALVFGFFALVLFLADSIWWSINFLAGGQIVLVIYLRARAQLLADAVYDCRDFLLVRNDGQEREVPLAQIEQMVLMKHSAFSNALYHPIRLKIKDGKRVDFLVRRNFDDQDLRRRILEAKMLFPVYAASEPPPLKQ